MATKQDLSRYRHTVASVIHLYYEPQPDGTNILRHIRANQKTYLMPTDGSGVTIDVVPPDSVGTDEIKDGSVQLQDLSPEARAAMGDRATYDEGSEQLSFD